MDAATSFPPPPPTPPARGHLARTLLETTLEVGFQVDHRRAPAGAGSTRSQNTPPQPTPFG
eukprot:274584-Prymnesium_polylepis.1